MTLISITYICTAWRKQVSERICKPSTTDPSNLWNGGGLREEIKDEHFLNSKIFWQRETSYLILINLNKIFYCGDSEQFLSASLGLMVTSLWLQRSVKGMFTFTCRIHCVANYAVLGWGKTRCCRSLEETSATNIRLCSLTCSLHCVNSHRELQTRILQNRANSRWLYKCSVIMFLAGYHFQYKYICFTQGRQQNDKKCFLLFSK
jgi:hypothetical protein